MAKTGLNVSWPTGARFCRTRVTPFTLTPPCRTAQRHHYNDNATGVSCELSPTPEHDQQASFLMQTMGTFVQL